MLALLRPHIPTDLVSVFAQSWLDERLTTCFVPRCSRHKISIQGRGYTVDFFEA